MSAARSLTTRYSPHAYHTCCTRHSPYVAIQYSPDFVCDSYFTHTRCRWQRGSDGAASSDWRRAGARLPRPAMHSPRPAIHTTRAAPKSCPVPGRRHAGPQWTAGPQDPRLTLRTAVQVGGIEPALPHVMRAMPLTPLPALLPSPPALTATLCRTSQPLYAVWPRPSAVPNNTRPRLFTPPPYQIPPTLPPAHRWRLGVRRRHTRVGEARVLRSCSKSPPRSGARGPRVAKRPMCSVVFFVSCRSLCDSSTCQ